MAPKSIVESRNNHTNTAFDEHKPEVVIWVWWLCIHNASRAAGEPAPTPGNANRSQQNPESLQKASIPGVIRTGRCEIRCCSQNCLPSGNFLHCISRPARSFFKRALYVR